MQNKIQSLWDNWRYKTYIQLKAVYTSRKKCLSQLSPLNTDIPFMSSTSPLKRTKHTGLDSLQNTVISDPFYAMLNRNISLAVNFLS